MVNFDVLMQSAVFDFYAVPVTFVPLASQPGQLGYPGRGILGTYEETVAAADGSSYADQYTILDIRESEFLVLPQQDDHCIIPRDCNGVPRGEYQIIDSTNNGGGQIMLKIRKFETHDS